MEKNENIEIKRIIDILFDKKIIILLILIIFTILGYFYSYHYVIPKYKSSSTLLLIPNNTNENSTVMNSDLTLNSELITTYSNIAKNSKVLNQVIQNLDLDMTEEELQSQMQVTVLADTYIIEITVTDTNAQRAKYIAQESANVFLSEIKQIYNLDNIGIIDEANIPEQPYNMNHTKNILLFIALGIMASGFYIMLIYVFDNTIKKEQELEKYLKIKPLGEIPVHSNKKQEIVDRSNAKSYVIECINTIRTNILYMNSGRKAKTILITSCTPQEGKSWVSSNVATSFAETNKKVLLVDCDMRKGRVSKIFRISNQEGLSNYLYSMTGNIKKDISLATKYIKETQIPNLHILTKGTTPPNPSELIDSSNMRELLAILKNIYDVIIIDAPPCKLVTDSIILSAIVDSTILVVSSGKTKINSLKEVKKSIQSVGGQIIGAVVNKVRTRGNSYDNMYYYGNGKEKEVIKEKNIITVKEVIREALPQLKEKKYNIFNSDKETLESKKENDIQSSKQSNNLIKIDEVIEKQKKELNKVINSITTIKSKLDDYHSDSIQLNEKIDNLNYTEKLEKIAQQIEKQNNDYPKIIDKIQKNYEKTLEKINEKQNMQEQIQLLLSAKMTQIQEEMEEKIQSEIAKINYADQINQINDMVTNLKDSYLELSNMIRINGNEKEELNSEKIVDIKTLKNRRKRKGVYSIEDNISYYDLEKTATCIVSLEAKKEGNFLTSFFQNAMR